MRTKRNDGVLRLNHFWGKRVPPQILNDVSREKEQPQNQSMCAIRIGIFMRRRFEPLNFKSIGTLACAFSRSSTFFWFETAFTVRQMQTLSVFLTLNPFVGEFERTNMHNTNERQMQRAFTLRTRTQYVMNITNAVYRFSI